MSLFSSTKKNSPANAKKKAPANRILTPNFRVSFPNMFEKKSNFEGQEPVYSIQMLFPKDSSDMKAMEKAAMDCAIAKWGPNQNEWPPIKNEPIADGDLKNLDSHKGHWVVNAKTKMKPGLIDQAREVITDPSKFYAGCWARATLTCYAYSNKGNNGVAFGLSNVQKIRDGEAFGGRRNAKDDFDEIEDLGALESEDFADDVDESNDF